MRLIVLRLAAAMLALGLAACSYPYRPPRFEPDGAQADFPGLIDLMRRSGTGLHVVWLHGMCPHSEACWAAPSALRLARLLGSAADGVTRSSLGAEGLVHRYQFAVEGKRVTLDMVVWSPIVQGLRDNLCFDSKRHATPDVAAACGDAATYPYPRASLNETLKSQIINTCLADALIYAGRYGATVRARLKVALSEALGEAAPADADGIAFISESLGSKILYDVLTELMDQPGTPRAKLAGRLAMTRQFFMFANQIPILDLASIAEADGQALVSGRARTSFQNLVRRLRPEKALSPKPVARGALAVPEALHVVAFTDPNDVLSYRMPQGYFGKRDDIVITNVLTSNAPVVLGLLADPAGAHSDYRSNPDAMALLACGRSVVGESCRMQARNRAESETFAPCAGS